MKNVVIDNLISKGINHAFGIPFANTGYSHYTYATQTLHLISKESFEYDQRYWQDVAQNNGKILYYKQSRNINLLIKLLLNFVLSFKTFPILLYKTSIWNTFYEDNKQITINIFEPTKIYYSKLFDLRFISVFDYLNFRKEYKMCKAIKNQICSIIPSGNNSYCLELENSNELVQILSYLTDCLVNLLVKSGNYIFYLIEVDLYIVLCHEGDVHIYSSEMTPHELDNLMRGYGDGLVINNSQVTTQIERYYPCD